MMKTSRGCNRDRAAAMKPVFCVPMLTAFVVTAVDGFATVAPPLTALRAVPRRASENILMKDWSKRKTLAETTGGANDHGAASVGLTGTIPVEFSQGNDTLPTMAYQGQPLSEVAAQAGQFIKYKCRKGECGTCAVRVEGQWIKTCSVKVPYVAPGDKYEVHVRGSMVKTKKSARFYSFRSIVSGWKNNVLGMVGFVKEGRKSQKHFSDRLEQEAEILERARAKRAAKEAAARDVLAGEGLKTTSTSAARKVEKR